MEVQKNYKLEAWQRLEAGEGAQLKFSVLRPGEVTLNVKSGEHVAVWLEYWETNESHLLGTCDGHAQFTFWASGSFSITEATGEIDMWVYTRHGDDWSIETGGGGSFARMYERPARDPAVERIMQQAMFNMESRMAAMAEGMSMNVSRALSDRDTRHAAEIAALKAERSAPQGAGDGGAASAASPADSGSSDKAATAAKGGGDSGNAAKS